MLRGTIIAQIIAFIGAVFLAKLYGEEAYGFFGLFISLISIISIISSLQLEKCIVISNTEKTSSNWFNFLLMLIPFITTLLFFLLFIFSCFFYREKLSLPILIMAFLGTVFFSVNLLHQSFFTYKKQFSIISNSKIFLTLINVFLQFILFSAFNLLGLIIGFLISQFLILGYYFFRNKNVISKTDKKEIKKGLKENAKIIKFLLPSNVINGLANHLMPILILSFFGAKEAGVYFFSMRILGSPLFLISSSISQVFFQKSSELFKENKKELFKLTKKIIASNLLLMLVFLILLNTIGIYLLEIYFNGKWVNLRLYILILSIFMFARTSFSPISNLIVVLNKNFTSLIFNCYLLFVNLIAIYFGYLFSDITKTIYILTIFGGLGYVLLVGYFLKHLKVIAKNND